jgi:hypothetical protein
MYSLLACVFIAGAAGGAAYLWQKPTVARGDVLAQDVGTMQLFSGAADLTCDDQIPIGVSGAEFHCSAKNGFGDREAIGCALDKDGSLRCHVDDTTRAPRPELPADTDSWGR